MLTPARYAKLQGAIKSYCKTYLHGKYPDLDESGTRLLINSFLTNVLGFTPIEEVKTEYMIRGTYADYMVQLGGKRYFLVEVKALSLTLSEKHLRQATHYGADEGIEWALLTNGKDFEMYRILFTKPIEARCVFSIDLSDPIQVKKAANMLQYLHKDSVTSKGLDVLWSRTQALDPKCIAGLLYSPTVVSFIRRTLKEKYKAKFSEEDVEAAITRLVTHPIALEDIKPNRAKKERAKREARVEVLVAAAEEGTASDGLLPADGGL